MEFSVDNCEMLRDQKELQLLLAQDEEIGQNFRAAVWRKFHNLLESTHYVFPLIIIL